jgi:hypothetical protein
MVYTAVVEKCALKSAAAFREPAAFLFLPPDRPSPGRILHAYTPGAGAFVNIFRINACKSVSKQTSFRINTYEKRGEGGAHTGGADRARA